MKPPKTVERSNRSSFIIPKKLSYSVFKNKKRI